MRATVQAPHVTSHKSVPQPSTLFAFVRRERRLCGVCNGKHVTCVTARMSRA
jgi:hypothetical protein